MYAHNITDAMDNTVITHFMQLNAEWSFFGSLVIFRQELVILADLKYPCLNIKCSQTELFEYNANIPLKLKKIQIFIKLAKS